MKNFKISVLIKYVLSYVAIFIIPIIIFAVLINSVLISNLQKEGINSNILLLEKAKEAMERRNATIQSVSLSIKDNNALSKDVLTLNKYKMLEGVNMLKNYKLSDSGFYDILYYIKDDSNMIYSALQSGSMDLIIDRVYKFKDWRLNEFQYDINNVTVPLVKPTQSLIIGDGDETLHIMPFLYPVPVNMPKIMLIYLIDEEILKFDFSLNIKKNTATAMILDSQNNMLFQANVRNDLQDEVITNLGTQKSSSGILNLKNNRVATFVKSDSLHWTFLMIEDASEFSKSVSFAKTSYAYAILVVLLLGIATILVFSHWNYKPIKKLLNIMGPAKGVRKLYGEFDLINHFVDEILIKNNEMSSFLENQKIILKNHALRELLKGNQDEVILQLAGDNEKKQSLYVVMCFEAFEMERCNEVLQFMNTFFIEHNFDFHVIDGVEVNEYCYILEFDVFDKAQIEKMLNQLAKGVSKEFGVTMHIGVSDICREIIDIGRAHMQAMMALRSCNGELIKIFDNSNNYDIAPKVLKQYDQLKTLNLYINTRNVDQIKKTATCLIESISKEKIPLFFKRCMFYDVFNILIKLMMENDLGSKYLSEFNVPDMSKDKLCKFLDGVIDDLVTYLCDQHNGETEMHIMFSSIKEIIDAEYCNEQFSLEKIAVQNEISLSYLSQLFKSQAGITPSEYIWELRLERAKDLLLNSDLKLNEIVKEIGLLDVSSFSKKFKKSTGQPPGQFRKREN
ncbi:MAG: AraC family transcriptional regulator [Firmicutes bacterium]|nr:AraC family transcriptional regulator [Bacillota bacterium]